MFYLGAFHPIWLSCAGIPLFVSHRWLKDRKTLPRAIAPWALDSGGFTELGLHGAWQTRPSDYVASVRRYSDEIGNLVWAAPQDWMCEPVMLSRTGLSVAEHQRRTIDNLLTLRSLDPDLPIIPVLQGWTCDDYLRHVDAYATRGIDLAAEPTVGVGTMCRRQHTAEASEILDTLADLGLRLHGFGLKINGLRASSGSLVSADSMAWSFSGRRTPTRCGSTTHKSEQNCLTFALEWRNRILEISQC